MAYYQIKVFINALQRYTHFEMYIPNDVGTDLSQEDTRYTGRKMKTLFLLQGFTGYAENWVPEELCQKYNFAVVMPNGENSFYLDSPSSCGKYGTYVGKELVEYVQKTFGLADCPENTYIMGMSMGGFGAIHTALAYPETFGKAGAMSAALIIHEIAHMKEGEANEVANYDYYHNCFGDLDTVEESDQNPETLIQKLLIQKKQLPKLYLCCGTEDFLIEKNREFHQFLEKHQVEHEYHESEGDHNMVFWREYIVKIVAWMFQ